MARGCVIIAISCENYEYAKKAYRSWLRYLQDTEPECIGGYSDLALCVDMDKLFRYVFFDCFLEDVIGKISDQVLYQDEFFFLEGVGQDYWPYSQTFKEVWNT